MENTEIIKSLLKKHQYHLVGEYAGVKLCDWLKKSLKNEGYCYKQQFYGIESHKCMQMSPCVSFCQHKCGFCWRPVEHTISDKMAKKIADEPEEIIEGCIEGQRKLICGYKGNPKTDIKKFNEAQSPKHAAISLSGEPTLYPWLDALISGFKKRDMTTFLVTNGINPKGLNSLNNMPTQLYLSLCASNPEMYAKIHNAPKSNWKKLLNVIDIYSNFNTRRTIRMTLQNSNMANIKEYAKLIEKANPHFVECKAYMHVGFSAMRLPKSEMPFFEDINSFSQCLSEELGYEIIDEKKESRVVLLAPKDYKWRKLK
ncbi:MAG: 4-demethylwyosine synthase TYW1 [Candidatus Nanoarchaeia archaeon]|nr:4-demethylwyosine synthase TYW1 [Candidatus Nanoarchaeia archaeon]